MKVNLDPDQGVAGRIEVDGLTKRFGDVVAVDDLSFTVEPGSITGFLGPNGAGKTTTLRMLLGLVRPDKGRASICGVEYVDLPAPATIVGAALEATGFHPARSGRDHLRVYCTVNRLPKRRADEVLDVVGLGQAKRRKVGGYSLGMRQRLALGAALLGDPAVLILDEPANGLDPDGIVWMRRFLREYAERGRTVLVSSHVLTEMQQLVDRVVILNRGRLVREATLAGLSEGTSSVLVRSPDPTGLTAALDQHASNGTRARRLGPDLLEVTGTTAAGLGHIACAAGIELHELTPRRTDLEQVFLDLTGTLETEPS
ncbi:MAG: ATP-binding cassette domain-containing protein [Propionibacteriales bacterium]|nr:ATP-binding cassette domain-containing protein [Propionibacteriales bacterium]